MSTHIDTAGHVIIDIAPQAVRSHPVEVTFVTVTETYGTEFDDYMFSLGALRNEDYEIIGCECEQDWNCSLHGGTSRPTWIETRYDGMGDW